MALKRKRSSPTFSSPISTASDTSMQSSTSLPFFYAQSKPTDSFYQKSTWPFSMYDSDGPAPSNHLNSRTRKRHRDDRPDEQSIYATTISRLYEAQRHQPHAEPLISSELPPPQSPVHAQRSTLHAFWNIGSTTTAAPPTSNAMLVDSAPQSTRTDLPMRCEDCDNSLRADDTMDWDDGSVAQEAACHFCRRRVCDRCAVLGNERICLACATSGR